MALTKKTVSESDTEFLNEITFEPLNKANWGKFEKLFGERGACGNCWCMYYRTTPAEFKEGKSEGGNRQAMKALVWENRPTGILAFYQDLPIGWCAFAPRNDFSKLARSRIHKPIDKQQVWSIPCFFIHKNFRKSGVSVQLLKGVTAYARKQGIKILEAYPTLPTTQKLPDSFAWVGLYQSFERAGFTIVDRTSKNRPMVRYYTNKS